MAMLGGLPGAAQAAAPNASEQGPIALTAGATRLALAGSSYPATRVWAYNGTVPGPELRLRQGDQLDVDFHNGLSEETTIHWHGIRLPNDMDGVPDLTQRPVAPGERFHYRFGLPDAGTFWYHPHHNSAEQVGRGLLGPLIVEEPSPPRVDRDLVWMLGDWRLNRDAQIVANFAHPHDLSHAGRIGNTVTVNGQVQEVFPVRPGERLRLRLINAANARFFELDFEGHKPTVIAYDGQPVSPHVPDGGRVVLGPAMRADVILDMTGKPHQRFRVVDQFYRRRAYRLLDLVYRGQPLRTRPLADEVALPSNPLPKPVLAGAVRQEIRFAGGMMMRTPPTERMMSQMHQGKFWFLNGVAANGPKVEPLFTVPRGQSVILSMLNDTSWDHPMHLHGHSFLVLERNGQAPPFAVWRDTLNVRPGEKAVIAFVADNPGRWMFHCHILEHQMSGMMGIIRVS